MACALKSLCGILSHMAFHVLLVLVSDKPHVADKTPSNLPLSRIHHNCVGRIFDGGGLLVQLPETNALGLLLSKPKNLRKNG